MALHAWSRARSTRNGAQGATDLEIVDYELTKMAVTSARQGRGYGRQLLSAAIDRFLNLEGDRLYLESHSSLTAALALYESAGFHHEARPTPSDYERADVYRVSRLE